MSMELRINRLFHPYISRLVVRPPLVGETSTQLTNSGIVNRSVPATDILATKRQVKL